VRDRAGHHNENIDGLGLAGFGPGQAVEGKKQTDRAVQRNGSV